MTFFEDIANRAATEPVDGKDIDLRYPDPAKRMELQAHARRITEQSDDTTDEQLVYEWEILTAMCLAETVVTDEKQLTVEHWGRIVRAANLNARPGLDNLVKRALELCGFNVTVRNALAGAATGEGEGDQPTGQDHVAGAAEDMGGLPST